MVTALKVCTTFRCDSCSVRMPSTFPCSCWGLSWRLGLKALRSEDCRCTLGEGCALMQGDDRQFLCQACCIKLVAEQADSQFTGCHRQQQQVVPDSNEMCQYPNAMSYHDEQPDMKRPVHGNFLDANRAETGALLATSPTQLTVSSPGILSGIWHH